MPAFADLIDLQTAVVEHVGTAKIVDVFPRLVQMAEVNINRRLRCQDMVTRTTLTLASGSAPLPADFIEALGVYNSIGYEYIQQPLQSVLTTNTTQFYAIGAGTLVTKITAGTVLMDYYAQVPTLTTSPTTSNWVLAKHPGLYLYAVGLEAAKYLKDIELAKVTSALADMEYDAAEKYDNNSRYSRARVRVAGVTP